MASSGRKHSSQVPDALSAVALQDHLVRTLNLNTSLGATKKLTNRLAYKKPVGKAVVDSNIRRSQTTNKDSGGEAKEYVLDKQPPAPTLAQKLGLIEQPKSLLNEREWAAVKQAAEERQDFSQPCVICKEDIGKLCHVVLSCTHVFHKSCIQAFERFSGKKSCPMCRKESYQVRVVYNGVPAYHHKCATRIQAVWKGFVVRCWYRNLRKTVPPKDPRLRQSFFEEKLQTITDRMVKSMDMGVNELLYDVTKNLEASRLIFQQFDARQREISSEQWLDIHRKALERGSEECPICLTQVTGGNTAGMDSSGATHRSAVLTSCTHIFHETCLEMFETLAITENKNCCPVCRAVYQKRVLPSYTEPNKPSYYS